MDCCAGISPLWGLAVYQLLDVLRILAPTRSQACTSIAMYLIELSGVGSLLVRQGA